MASSVLAHFHSALAFYERQQAMEADTMQAAAREEPVAHIAAEAEERLLIIQRLRKEIPRASDRCEDGIRGGPLHCD